MALNDNIDTQGVYNLGLIKPVEGVNRQPTARERREKQPKSKPATDQVVLSKAALENSREENNDDEQYRTDILELSVGKIDFHV
ncbi:MAG: hypothetical protein ABIA75_01620 [Candidatus Neomarinimicrobiota bacterium]